MLRAPRLLAAVASLLVSRAVAVRCLEAAHVPSGARDLPGDVVWQVLALVAGPVQAAWATGGEVAGLWEASGLTRQLHSRGVAPVVELRFFPLGDRVLGVRADGSAVVWDAASGRALRELWRDAAAGLFEHFEAQVFPDGDRVVALGSDGGAVIWSAATGAMLWRLDSRDVCTEHRTIRVLAGGELLVTGASHTHGDAAVVWNATDGTPLRLLRHGEAAVSFLEAPPMGTHVATASRDDVLMWCAATGRAEWSFRRRGSWIFGLALSGSGGLAVSMSDGRSEGDRVFVVDVATGRPTAALPMADIVHTVATIAHGARLVAVSGFEAVVWDIVSGKPMHTLEGDLHGLLSIVADPAGHAVAACGLLYTDDEKPAVWVRIWDASTGRLVHQSEDPDITGVRRGSFDWRCAVAIGPRLMMSDLMPGLSA